MDDETSFAFHYGRDQSLISRRFDPNKPKDELGLSRAVREVYAFYASDFPKGDEYVLLFNHFAADCRRMFSTNGYKEISKQRDKTQKSLFQVITQMGEEVAMSERIKFGERAIQELQHWVEGLRAMDMEDAEEELQHASTLQ
jgi:hypothetical protein